MTTTPPERNDPAAAGGPTPMERLRAVSPTGAEAFLAFRKATLDNPALQAVPLEQKLLIGIAVAAALQSETCTRMWTGLALDAGATPARIAEAILVARLMKAATVQDTAAEALAHLEAAAGRREG